MTGLDDGDDRIAVETRIRARAETISGFFTDPALYRLWMGESAVLDARSGGIYRVTMPDGATAEGWFVLVEAPSRVVFTWGWVGDDDVPPGSTTVDVRLTPDGNDTVVTVLHTGLPSRASMELHAMGWEHFLARLADVADVTAVPSTTPQERT